MSFRSLKAALTAVTLMVSTGAAHAELVVIVNPKSAATALSTDQVANVFLGKTTDFIPANLPEASAARSEFYSKVTGKDAAQVKAIWTRLIFTSNINPPKEFSSAADAVKFVASNEKAIAYVDKSAVDASVKAVLTLN